MWQRHVDVRPVEGTAEYAHWESILASNTDFCEQKIGNVLMFPGGWLLGVEWEGDQRERDALRMAYVPELCRMLHRILHQTGRFRQVWRERQRMKKREEEREGDEVRGK